MYSKIKSVWIIRESQKTIKNTRYFPVSPLPPDIFFENYNTRGNIAYHISYHNIIINHAKHNKKNKHQSLSEAKIEAEPKLKHF